MPFETTTASGRRIMDKLLRMLDNLDEKLFADQHVDDDYPGLLAEGPVKFSKDADEQSQDTKSQQRSDLKSKVGKKTAITNSTRVEREQEDDDLTFFLLNKKLSELINKFDKPAEGEEELMADSAKGELLEEDAEMTGQKESESQAEDVETVVIKSDDVDFESRDLPLKVWW
ncbi:hypothetical protein KCU83_g2806, partial [Aureobasidium melanogenum]